MKNIYTAYIVFIILLLAFIKPVLAQTNSGDSNKYKKIAVGPEYKRSSFYQWLWGKNYRKEWTTPVEFPVAMLDTLQGGDRIL